VLIVRVHPEILRAEKLPTISSTRLNLEERFRSITGLRTPVPQRDAHPQILPPSSKRTAQALPRAHRTSRTRTEIQPRRHRGKKYWKQYMKAYEECPPATSSRHAPCTSSPPTTSQLPADRLAHSIVTALEELDMSLPRADAARPRELQAIRRRLAK